jgi:hypothetical protein
LTGPMATYDDPEALCRATYGRSWLDSADLGGAASRRIQTDVAVFRLIPAKNSTSRFLAQIVVLSSIGMNIGGFDHCIPFRGFAEYVVHKFRGTALQDVDSCIRQLLPDLCILYRHQITVA